MTPGELSRIEDTLRRAYGDVLESVRREGSSPELMPGFQPGRSASWCPGLPTIDDWHCSTARSVAAADVWLRRTGGDPGV